jgi:hypothetical protein
MLLRVILSWLVCAVKHRSLDARHFIFAQHLSCSAYRRFFKSGAPCCDGADLGWVDQLGTYFVNAP